jgi:hypothetical protein
MRDESGSSHGCTTASAVARAIRVAIVTLCLPVHGCDTVDGGAVELSWKLRPASSGLPDKFVDCDPGSGEQHWGPVTRIRLSWEVSTGGAPELGFEEWACQDNHGATGFVLPKGTANLLITPECGTSNEMAAAMNTYIAPAIVQREVTRGATVSLGAVELVVSVSDCDTQPCICVF